MQTHYTIPDAPDNYPLDPSKGLFSVVIPEATTNLVTNPSLETGTTGWTASGAVIARSTAQQRRGVYSLAVTPTSAATDGVYFGTVALVAGTTYTASVDVLGAPGVEYRLFVANTSAAAVSSIVSFTGTGRWQRVDVTYPETSSASRRIYITKRTGTSTAVFYVDGLQVEAKSYPTTYCDGDQQGLVPGQVPPPYLWAGTPHASTSARSALTRAGGREYLLATLGLTVLAYTGLGVAGVDIVDDAYAQGDGALYQNTYVPARTFAITGVVGDTSFQQLQRKRAALQNAFRPNRGSPRQPLLLRYQNTDGCGNARGLPLDLVCVYAGGLEGETTNRYQEKMSIRLTMHDPYIHATGDSGSAPTISTAVAAAGIVQRSAAGVWAALGTGLTGGLGQARDILTLPNGTMYVGGDFTDAGGSGADYLAQWNGASWAVVGSATALNATVLRIRAAPNGTTIYVAGGFTNASGIANADYLAQWDGSSWSALGTPANNTIRALAVGPDGTLYAGGDFTDIGGSGADYIAKWDGSAWSVLGSATALDNPVTALAFGSDGYLYASGGFTNASGVANTAGIARWNGSAWSSAGGSMTGSANDLFVGLDGQLYAVGSISAVGGVAVQNAARFNGTSWAALGSGATNTLQRGATALDGTVYVVGASTIDGLSMGGFGRWNGSSWVFVDAAYAGTTGASAAVEVTPAGVLNLGLSSATSTAVTAGAITSVTNAGSADAYPVLTLTGPGRVKTLINATTGDAIFFNLTLLAGETAVLDLTPGNISFVSTFRGNILSTIMPGSNLATWRLASGANAISLLIDGTTTAATIATLRWRAAYWSVDDGTE